MTPEEWLIKKPQVEVVIFDEFHLLTYWGDTFRPVLRDVFEEISLSAGLVIGLTATLSENNCFTTSLFYCHFDTITWVDHGNQSLKWRPASYLAGSQTLVRNSILHLPLKKTSLIFCRYREEVLEWKNLLEKNGFTTWACLGGEASEFAMKVRTQPAPDFIVATTVLSHGVNLPSISRVFILYQIANIDFWIQMIARGGRRGEVFEVFALEPPYGLRWSRGFNLLRIGMTSVRLLPSILIDQLDQCFLKE